MATKTISIELDVYEKLKAAKRGSESFSQVLRRARFESEPLSGAELLSLMETRMQEGNLLAEEELERLENMVDLPPEDKWASS